MTERRYEMKLAVTSTGPGLEDQIDPRFGRCVFFLVIDTETMEVQAISNASAAAGGGAGIQAAQTVANSGAEMVITGNVGPNAFRTLAAAGMKIITGAEGSVKDAVERVKSGKLNETEAPTVGSHFGMGGN